MAYETVLYDKADYVATITLNRPEALNAFSTQQSADLLAALREAEADAEVRCVIITGAGRAFSAGSDLGGGQRSNQAAQPAEPPSQAIIPGTRREGLLEVIWGMTTPVIAAINGVGVGMGASLPAACDLRTMAESARLAFIFVKRALTPEYGSSFTLPRLIGWTRASELLFTGRFIGAQEAKEIGLVNQVFPDAEFMAGTMELAKSIAANPPISVKYIKRELRQSMDESLASALDYEQIAFAACQKTEDYRESVRAFFEKRDPVFKGR